MKIIQTITLSIFSATISLTSMSTLTADSFESDYIQKAQEPGTVIFNPPESWHIADPQALPPSVKIMVVGQSGTDFPPSINLGTEKYSGTLKDYLKTIKNINDAQGADWKDLGTIRTQAGTASLSQVDAKTEWGEIRMMHVIVLREGTVYILTAAALKEEFSKYYKDFFKSMRSLRFNKNVYEAITSPSVKAKLLSENQSLKSAWEKLLEKEKENHESAAIEKIAQDVFNSEEFQVKFWTPYKECVSKDFQELGPSWRKQLLNQVQSELMTSINH
ncbi:MAG: hypothetical protein AAGG81_06845 [Chlamydiota bacterium]